MEDASLLEPGSTGYRIKSLKSILKDFESIVKDVDLKGRSFLIDGNNSPKKSDAIGVDNGDIFKMRYREAWGNWLLCAVLSVAHGQDHIFQDDTTVDGVIINKKTDRWFPVEHVSALTNPKAEELPKEEDRVLWAINKKLEKAAEKPGYAKGKSLVVFFDGAEKWYPNKVGRSIGDRNGFEAIYGIGLISTDNEEYSYSVTEFKTEHSPTFTVKINKDFTDWAVTQDQ